MIIDGQVERIKTIWNRIPQEVVAADSDVTGTFSNEEKELTQPLLSC
jgi:trigger factor